MATRGADNIGAGIVRNNAPPDTLQLSFGAAASVGSDPSKLTVRLQAGLARFAAATVTGEFGDVILACDFPVPLFLKSGSVSASHLGTTFALDLKAERQSKQIDVHFASGGDPAILAWDGTRLAAFVARAFVAAQAAADPKGFFYRLDEHFFPLFGDPPGSIKPLVPLDATGTLPVYTDWANSMLDPGNAMTVLWHLRALATGNEDIGFLHGSRYFQLVASGNVPAAPTPPASFIDLGSYPGPSANGKVTV